MKNLFIFLLVSVCAVGAMAQDAPKQLTSTGTSAFIMATGWSEKPFTSFEGGVRAGITLPLDSEKGLFLRTAYQSLSLTDGDAIQSIEVMPLLSWYVGTKWEFYLTGGLTGYVGGENSGIDGTGGFGVARRLWTQTQGTFVIPASIDVFGEVSFTDAGGQPSGGLAQLSIGIKINKSGN